MEYILVTGAAGFIGKRVIDQLSKYLNVIGVDNFDSQIHGEMHEQLDTDILKFDIGKDNFDKLSKFGTPTGIVHLAAATGTGQSMYELEHYYRTNILGTAKLIDFALKHKNSIKNFVFASSRSVYGEGTYYCKTCEVEFPGQRYLVDMEGSKFNVFCQECGQISEAVATRESASQIAVSQYALTKICNEKSIELALQPTNIKFCNLRLQNVYGVGQSLNNPYTGVLGIFATLAKNGMPISIYENGTVARDFVHVSDVVNIIEQTLKIDQVPSVVNVGTGVPIKLLDVAQIINDYYGAGSSIVKTSKFRIGDISTNFADLSICRKVFDNYNFKKFDTSIHEYLDWVQCSGGVELDKVEASLAQLKSRGLLLG